ncbi:hypothetical protein BGZ59_002073 [Podila verticillata]|nr:hypothetical protein BGZ59_002073 [Podila verticillata]KFH71350.1 hypothetical protein MVEG_01650 [Podila verticillata NRRL 6337]
MNTAASEIAPATGAGGGSNNTSAPSLQTEDEYEQLKRFQIELEFVQCLANPWYLHNLAQQGYFGQDAFVRYLDYLQYFRKPEYAKFIIYPHCLHFLTLLQHKSFREQLAKQDTATYVHERQYYHWQYLRNQDKVVRMEIAPDGSRVEIKSDTASGEGQQQQQLPSTDFDHPMTTAPGVIVPPHNPLQAPAIGAPNGSINLA